MINNIKLFKLWYFLATGFGIGTISYFIPVGTLASFIAIPIWWILVSYFSYKIYFIFLVFATISGIYFCGKINKIIGIHDHKSIVWDEFIGMWITLSVIPKYNILWIIIAFLLFRILDILKPWPISWCDKIIKGGFGIIIDDIIASIISIGIILFFI